MSDDSFEHDADRFRPVGEGAGHARLDTDDHYAVDERFETRERFEQAAHPGGIDFADAEARYADLFAEIIWDGTITAEKRQRLLNASHTFQIHEDRVSQIEQSLIMAHQARYQFAVVEEETSDVLGSEQTGGRHSVMPFAAAEEPGMLALQRRIGKLEEDVYNAGLEKQRHLDHIRALEKLVEQLQFALESTLEELDDTHRELDSHGMGAPPPEASAVVDVAHGYDESPTPPTPPRPFAAPPTIGPVPSRFDTEAPPPEHSMAQVRSGQADALAWDADAFVIAPRVVDRRENPDAIYRQLLLEPRNAGLLHALFQALGRGEDVDRRWCVAHVLVFLGEADGSERELEERYASTELVSPTRAVNDDEWRELLFHPEEDVLTGEILSAIAPAVLLGHLTAMRASIAPAVLDPDTHVDPKTSTLQAVRCLAWAAALLGLKTPPLYVEPKHPSAAEIVLNPTPSTRIGKVALSGRDTRELAFIAGRHLAWYRREHLLGKPQRSTRRLEDMFLAALMIGNPGLPITAEVKERVQPLARTIRPLLDAATMEKLQHGFTQFVEAGGRTNLSRWFRSVERTAACAGLLLANDLPAAHRMLELEDPTKAADELDELIRFFTAGRCTLLRQRIGIAVG